MMSHQHAVNKDGARMHPMLGEACETQPYMSCRESSHVRAGEAVFPRKSPDRMPSPTGCPVPNSLENLHTKQHTVQTAQAVLTHSDIKTIEEKGYGCEKESGEESLGRFAGEKETGEMM